MIMAAVENGQQIEHKSKLQRVYEERPAVKYVYDFYTYTNNPKLFTAKAV
jgi:hypothetical protein